MMLFTMLSRTFGSISRALTAGALCAVTASSANAAEVTVQNDSLAVGGTGSVQAGFVEGESAAAWLTAPCNGNIVAVQVFWRSVFGGSPQILGDTITVFGDGIFPTPGPVMTSVGTPSQPAVFEGPVMSDGVINEFRYLDEQSSIPLRVPVVQGQRFVVSFKFFESPGLFDPSVVTDTGCQAGKNSIFAIPGGWMSACAAGITGDFVIRAVIDCVEPTGACCIPNGQCLDGVTSSACTSQGGVYRGNNSTCATQTCPEFARACCFSAGGGTCQNLTPTQCTGFGGTPGPAGSTCSTYVCFPMGACCLPNGQCIGPVSPANCAAQGGNFQGHLSTCGGVTCPQPIGACCSATGFCAELSQIDCNGIPGATWKGVGTTCADVNGNGTADICEAAAPCPGDANGDRSVGLADIAVVVQHWGQTVPPNTNGDMTGDGSVGLADIAVIIQHWAATCP
ncbi:MAG TPA: dockerin type I domain-containing protein [Phycisphaerales bacterium]|nr:dockerin type I domain-containing protein [Phycisphaerales bacterium]